jgi:hypothetical protein
MRRVHVRSRIGNMVLAAAGVLYAVSAAVLLVWLTIDVWGAAGRIDQLMQIGLLVAGACGVWLFFNSRANLRESTSSRQNAYAGEHAEAR